MASFIVQQPNGKYCVFSTVVDDIITHNLSKDKLIDFFTERIIKETKERINEDLSKPAMTFSEIKKAFRIYTQEELDEHKKVLKEMGDERYNEIQIIEIEDD